MGTRNRNNGIRQLPEEIKITRIVYVKYGLANRFPDGTIELNENLPKFKELHDAVLAHELSHTDEPGFTKKDFLLDLAPTKVSPWKLFKFMCIYPKSFLQFAPFYIREGTFIYDINLSIAWACIVGAIGTGIFLAIQ